MRTSRIHLDGDLRPGTDITLPTQAAAHVARVLRLRAGDELTLFNGNGDDYAAELTLVCVREVRARVTARQAVGNESPLRITLAQALARGEKMDWVVQKATELGATAITPLLTERSEVKLDATRARKRVAHWQAVAVSACEQCGRARLPRVDAPQSLESWLASLKPDAPTTRLILSPDGELTPRDFSNAPRDVVVAVGPEGGFGQRDLASLCAAGFRGLRLGPRVLRTETAGIVAITALQTLYGDL